MIFFMVAGFGFGNASRQLAIIKELRAKSPKLAITVFSWGQGARFLEAEAQALNFKFYALPHWDFNFKGSYVLTLLFTTLIYFLLYPLHIFVLLLWRLKYSPQVVVFDSDYHFPAFMFSRARRISINQAPYILFQSQSYSLSYLLKNGFFFSYLVEKIDFYLQLLFAHKILAPSFSPQKITNFGKKIRSIPLIVRQEFNKQSASNETKLRPALILGGSGLESQALKNWASLSGVQVFEKKLVSATSSPNLAEQLVGFNPLILQGGLSSLSEGVALRKYLLVLPIANHWEQFLNGQEVSTLSLGQITKIENLDAVLSSLSVTTTTNLPALDCSGALIVADYLLKELSYEV